MNDSQRIQVLVIPDLFPKFKGDMQGIFILDYLKATEAWCTNHVLFGRLSHDPTDVTEQLGETTIQRFAVSSKKVPFYLKPLYYALWFRKGYRLGKKQTGITLIHSHGSILSGTLSFLLAKKFKVPFIITEHQGPFSMTSDHFWKKHWTKYIMQKAAAVLTVSEHLKQEILQAGIHPKQILVTNNPVDTDLFALKKDQGQKNILFVARLDEFKGALRCVKAFDTLLSRYPDWTMTIIGDGEETQPINQYLAYGAVLKQRVHLKGQQSKAEIALAMQQASFMVFPSRHESFGLVVAEALSCGLPVIVGNKTAPKEFVTQSCGLLVEPDDIHGISSAMEQMIHSHTNYQAIDIRNHIITHFGFENFGKKMITIYQSFLNKR